jgi:hypothetical protein
MFMNKTDNDNKPRKKCNLAIHFNVAMAWLWLNVPQQFMSWNLGTQCDCVKRFGTFKRWDLGGGL